MKRLLFFILFIPVLACGQWTLDLGNPDNAIALKGTAAVDTTRWYISNDGDDTKHGHSQDSAISSFAELLTRDVEAGDKILFARNDTWRVTNTHYQGNLPWIGTANNPITISSYGLGDRPRILGSLAPMNWTQDGGVDRWWTVEAPDTFPDGRVWFVELDDSIKWGELVTYRTAVDEVNEYYHSNDTTYVYSTSDPVTAFTSVEIPQGGNSYAILDLRSDSDSAEHYIFDGLEIAYGHKHGIGNNYPGSSPSGRELSGITIRNCLIHHFNSRGGGSGYGAHISSMRDVIFEKNTVHNCGRRGFSYRMDNRDGADSAWNIIVQNNHFYDGWHTTGPDINNADGISNGTFLDSIIIRNNKIEENIDKDISGYTITGIFINDDGISTIANAWVYNNLIINRCAGAISSGGMDTLYAYNNTIYSGNVNRTDGYAIAINVVDSARIFNNIIYNSSLNPELVNLAIVNDSAVVNNNLYYSSGGYTDAFGIGGLYYSTWATWKSSTGQDTNSPTPADPLFKNPPTNLKVSSLSDAIGGGVTISGYTTDYDGVAVSDPPNIGAYETTED